MPELPEVQTTVNGLNKYIKGLQILDIWSSYESKFHTDKDNIKDPKYFSYFKKEIVGKKILRAERRAKNILIHLSGDKTILIHMKMTGHLLYGKYKRVSSDKWMVGSKKRTKIQWIPIEPGPLKDPFNRFVRLVFSFSNEKQLALSDMRRFAKVTLISKKDLISSFHLKHLGPEPLSKDFTFQTFHKQLWRKPKGKIKTILIDQSIISGIGNIYSDEALWLANTHPESKVKNIPDESLKNLYKAIQKVLKKGIDFGGDSMSDYRNILGKKGTFQEKHNVYRKAGQKCSKPRCGGTVVRKIVNGRSAHFCDRHQIKY